MARVWQQFDQLAISQVSIEKMTHSKMAEYRTEVRQAAIRAAKQRATDFAEAEEQPSLEFSKIKLSYRVQAKFVLE